MQPDGGEGDVDGGERELGPGEAEALGEEGERRPSAQMGHRSSRIRSLIATVIISLTRGDQYPRIWDLIDYQRRSPTAFIN